MTRFQSCDCDGTPYSSAFVEIDRANPAIYCDCSDLPSLTRQEFAEDCDINNLMSRYEKTGIINHFNNGTPQYLDLSDVPDLQRAHEVLQEASFAFNNLPAHIRREFDNDPKQFVAFATDAKNLDKMREWGLAKPVEEPAPPMKVEVINPNPPLNPDA